MRRPVEPTSSEINKRIMALKQVAVANFNHEDWIDIGLLTDSSHRIQNHDRLLRSLGFGDDDYGGHVGTILAEIVRRDEFNLRVLEDHVFSKYPQEGMDVFSRPRPGQKIVFQPQVFEMPKDGLDRDLVAVMMPFQPKFTPVFQAIERAARGSGMRAVKANDIWVQSAVVQDIFELIYRSFIVVCDFTGSNTNVFYEAGIAHTLGKHVIPITQSEQDIPFDLRHHRFLTYLGNTEGVGDLERDLKKRFVTLDEAYPSR